MFRGVPGPGVAGHVGRAGDPRLVRNGLRRRRLLLWACAPPRSGQVYQELDGVDRRHRRQARPSKWRGQMNLV